MAIDSAAKRKSAVAIGSPFVGPVVVPDSSISLFDRQAIGYSYGGIEIAAAVTAGFVCVESITLAKPSATVALAKPYAVVTRTDC